ncbi:MAG: efflux RND transporter periplasmic adaptor subunit, partial [Phycisphaerae bacterium]
AGEAGAVAADRPATVAPLGGPGTPAPTGLVAEPSGAPPVGTALTASIELTYQLANPSSAPFRPGERVAVTLPLRDAEDSLVLPWSAVVYDLYGGAWVYEVTGPRQYARRRVEVRYVDGGSAVLRAGPAPGAEVVSQGAAELFGREMGYAK